MPERDLGGVAIRSKEDLVGIKKNGNHKAESEFARLLLDKTDLEIVYEPTFFYQEEEDGVVKGTLPDFRVRNPNTGATTFIELTTSSKGKDKQKTYMKTLAPDVHYVVFFRDKLEAIERKFPEYSFFNGGESLQATVEVAEPETIAS